MTNNFRKFNEYKFEYKNKEIFGKIERIENKILDNDFDFIFLESRKIVEFIMYNYNKSLQTLDSKITNYFRENFAPKSIKNIIFELKHKGNEEAHAMIDDTYDISTDIHSSIVLLKNMFLVIKYFAIKEYPNSKNEISKYKFDSSLYLTSTNNVGVIESTHLPGKRKLIKAKSLSSMDDDQKLIRRLNTAGKKTFVEYFYTWDKEDLRRMEDKHGWGIGSASAKISGMRSIFKASQEIEALKIIVNSQRIKNSDPVTYSNALKILESITTNNLLV